MTRNTQLITIGLLLTFLSGTLTGCSAPARSTMAAEQASPASELSGTVVETMDASGYTYICIEKDGKKTWAAMTTTKIAVGQQIKLQNGAEMNNFQSKALNRTFDKIIFSGGVVQEAAAIPAASKATASTATAGTALKEGLLEGKVVETMNAASYTYILLEKDGRRSWAAIPATAQLAVGDEVELFPGTEMGNFKSKTLNRSFDNITFSGGLKSVNAKGALAPTAPTAPASLPTGHPKMDAPAK